MMAIDMTAQLGSILTALEFALLISTAALVGAALRNLMHPAAAAGRRTASDMATVGASPSVPERSGETPSDTSVPEAA
jgi:hypothetical protein